MDQQISLQIGLYHGFKFLIPGGPNVRPIAIYVEYGLRNPRPLGQPHTPDPTDGMETLAVTVFGETAHRMPIKRVLLCGIDIKHEHFEIDNEHLMMKNIMDVLFASPDFHRCVDWFEKQYCTLGAGTGDVE